MLVELSGEEGGRKVYGAVRMRDRVSISLWELGLKLRML